MAASEFLDKKIIDLESYEITVFNVVLLLIVLLVTWIGLKIIRKFIEKPFKNLPMDKGSKHSIFLIIKYVIWTISIIICLELIGVKVTLLLAGSAALLVGLGLGVQQIFNDLVSGMFLLFEGSVQVDDILEVDGMVCKVKVIQLRTSKVVTRDDVIKIVPNHKFITETVTNWSKQDQKFARFRTVMGVSYKSDPYEIQKMLTEIMVNHPNIISKGNVQPMVRFLDYADSSINFELVFHSESIFRIDNVLSDIRYQAFDAFRKNGVEIPFPQRDLHIKSSDVLLYPESKD